VDGSYLIPTGSFVRVYDTQTGIPGDWIEVPPINQVSNTEDFTDSAGMKLYYSGIDRDESKCFIVDGKFNEVIYGSRDSFLNSNIKYYDFVKGECNRYNSVDRNGNYKGAPPIITINGFLNLRKDDDSLSVAGEIITASNGNGFEYLPSTLEASLETSASLETYIYNL
jgi:hypothetical protein